MLGDPSCRANVCERRRREPEEEHQAHQCPDQVPRPGQVLDRRGTRNYDELDLFQVSPSLNFYSAAQLNAHVRDEQPAMRQSRECVDAVF